VTWQGDVLSLGAAVAIIGYMHIGAELRQTMPLFLYAFPVTATSAAFLSTAAARRRRARRRARLREKRLARGRLRVGARVAGTFAAPP
jgi:hypothetical protein